MRLGAGSSCLYARGCSSCTDRAAEGLAPALPPAIVDIVRRRRPCRAACHRQPSAPPAAPQLQLPLPAATPRPPLPPKSGPISPVKSTMMAGGFPTGSRILPKTTTSSSAIVVEVGERSPSCIAVRSVIGRRWRHPGRRASRSMTS